MWVLRLSYRSYLEEAAKTIQRCYRGYRSRHLRTLTGETVSFYFWHAESVQTEIDILEDDYYGSTECSLDQALRANYL